jgi:beta-glucosidase
MTEQLLRSQPVKKAAHPSYKNPDLPIDLRVADLLGRMTLQEKVAQMLCVWGQKRTQLSDETGHLDLGRVRTQWKDGLGQIGRLSDTGGGKNAQEMATLANQLQEFFVEETRLGIPVIFHEECLHGLAAPDATSYPQPIGLASTFNPELIEQIYTAIAEETRSRGAHLALTPVVDVARDPRWGRVEETFGEDPYLVSRLGIAAVRGFQGDGTFGDKKRVIATLKHFAAHGQPESGTNCGPGNFSERVLRDIFLFPFREVLEKAHPGSVMASYNEIDGLPSHANAWLLRDVLRKEWGFKGFVVSDYYAITELKGNDETVSHAVAKDKAEAAMRAIDAGVNIELPDPDCYPLLPSLVERGLIAESQIDELVAPLLEYKFRLGLFEDPYVSTDGTSHELRVQEERALALRAAQETIVLLKNRGGVLPLRSDKTGTIAVIGPNADRRLLGGYSGTPRYYTTVLQGIQARAGDDATILYSEGCKITVGGAWSEDIVTLPDPEDDRQSIARAVSTASKSDIVVLVLGDNEQTSREAWSYRHLGDRTNLDLFGMQNALVEAIASTGKPIVLVLFNGRPNSLNFVNDKVDAILECWYLGQETGRAVAEVLFGDCNPSGKLPISIPRSAGHLPCFYNHKPSARRGYLFDDITPLYPFGFGLSYTTFELSNLRLEASSIRVVESTRVLVDIRNTGSRVGQEVVQMYIRDVVSSVTRPVKELKGFAKTSLKPGEVKTVALSLHPEHLSFTNVDKVYGVEPGDFEIMVGTSSRSEDLSRIILHVTHR